MLVRFHPHALERMKERGATDGEVETTVKEGEQLLHAISEFRRGIAP